MKKIGLLLLLFVSSAFAERWGVGVNYPGLGVKYTVDKMNTVELRTQFGEDVFVMGPRLYHSISNRGKTTIYAGGELDYLTFEGKSSKGSGFVLEPYVGVEYLIEYLTAHNLGLNIDIGPAFISLKDKDTNETEAGIDFVVNLGLTYYLGGEK